MQKNLLLFIFFLTIQIQARCPPDCPLALLPEQCRICLPRENQNLNQVLSPPTIYLIRHGRSTFNKVQDYLFTVNKEEEILYTPQYDTFQFDLTYQDSDLDPDGEFQCLASREKMKDIALDLIVVSPLRRALKTAGIIFNNHSSNSPVVVDPLFREILESGCDVGSMLNETMRQFPHYNYSLIKNTDYWYIDTLTNETKRQELNQLIQKSAQTSEELNKKVKKNLMDYLKDLKYRRKVQPDLISYALSPFEIQKKRLKKFLQTHKTIALVTHSMNLKSYVGIKLKNCQIMVFKPSYFELPLEQRPRLHL